MKKLLLLASFTYSICSISQNISTIAGTGIQNFSGDGGLAIDADIYNPIEILKAASGNIYFVEKSNGFGGNRVRKIDSLTGIITTVAGDGTYGFSGDGGLAINAQLNDVRGIALDSSENIYISDYLNNRIRKVTFTTGIITTIAGNGINGYLGDGGPAVSAELRGPEGICLDKDGNIFFTDWVKIRRIDFSSGVITTVAGTGTPGYSGDGGFAISAELSTTTDITIDTSGNLFFTDLNNGVIREIKSSNDFIYKIAGTGITGFSGDGGLAINAQLGGLTNGSINIDDSGNIYIADADNNRIRKVDTTSGIITTVVGIGTYGFSGDNGLAVNAELAYPSGIFVDGSGIIYIADTENNRLRQVGGQSTSGIEVITLGTKKIVKIVDLTGRETAYQKNQVLIYIYSDGTTKKVFVFE